MSGTEFGILGPLRVHHNGREVTISGVRQRVALGLLLLETPHAVADHVLIDNIWERDPPATAREQLRNTMARLRQALPLDAPRPVRDAAGYRLHPAPEIIDAQEFAASIHCEDFEQAFRLWRGATLSGLDGPAIRAAAARHEQQYLSAWEGYAQAGLDAGRHRELIADLTSLVCTHPLRERLVSQLALAQFREQRTPDALATLRAYRRLLSEEHGLDPSQQLASLEKAILCDDRELRLSPPIPTHAQQGVAVQPIVPRELPADLPDFTGRVVAIKQLDALATKAAHANGVIVIAGIGGIGKTALAVHWAHARAHQYPDGQLYINLHGYSRATPTSPDAALATMLTALGLPREQVPADTAAAAARYRSLVSGHRMLIVLDNARSAEQIRPLLPASPGCLAMVTSRDRLSGLMASDGAKRVTLDVLSEDEALHLLSEVVGARRVDAELDAARLLAKVCGKLPLALRVAAAQLADNPFRTLAAHASALKASNPVGGLSLDKDMAVSTTLDLSYRALPPTAQVAFRRLGLVALFDFTAESLSRLTATSVSEATTALDQLAAAHLVVQHKPDRYSLHDLVRHFASWITDAADTEEELAAAVQRLCNWYLATISDAALLLYPMRTRWPGIDDKITLDQLFSSASMALQWLAVEQQNLVATILHAARHGPFPMAWQLTDRLSGYYDRYQARAQRLNLARAAVAAARTHGDDLAKAIAYQQLAHACFGIARLKSAAAYLTKAAKLCVTTDWKEGEASAALNLATFCIFAGDLDKASEWASLAATLYEGLGSTDGKLLATNAIVRVYLARGHLREAITLARHAGTQHPDLRSPAKAQWMVVMANLYSMLGRHNEAVKYASDALRQEHPYSSMLTAEIHLCLSAVHFAAGDRDLARDHAERGTAVSTRASSVWQQTQALAAMADVDLASGDRQQALSRYEQALQAAEATDHCHMICTAQLGLAQTYSTMDNHHTALGHAQHALTVSQLAGYSILQGKAMTELALIHRRLGAADLARDFACRALTSHRSNGYRKGVREAIDMLRRIATD